MLKKVFAITLVALALAGAARGEEKLYQEKYRPQFHFTAQKNWLNDPNGLVYFKGTYHLFFQHNPLGINWGNMHWGHAVSPDLIHWRELPIALSPDAHGTNYSGSAVVDWANTSGLQQGAVKVLAALYTGAPDKNNAPGKKFTQCLAYSTDAGRTWLKYAQNPVLESLVPYNRDPRVFWHAPSRQWVMALYLVKNDFAFFASKDLKSWKRLSGLTMKGGAECPELFELPVYGEAGTKTGQTRWIFYAASGDYMVGNFDGTRFTPETQPLKQDWGKNFYASQTYSDIPEADGRRIQIAWMRKGEYPGMPFNQQMSFPCELRLVQTADGPRLTRQPVREIERIHAQAVELKDLALAPGDERKMDVRTGLLDIRAEFEPGVAGEVGLIVDGEKIAYSAKERALKVLGCAAPLEPAGGRVRIRVLADRTSLEVFGNGGLASLSSCFLPRKGAPALTVYATGAPARLIAIEAHALRSTWQDQDAYEKTIEKFEQEDIDHPRAPGGIVFIGSSTFTMWKSLEDDMKPLAAINRGFGGSQMFHTALYADRIVIPHRPKAVVVYSGANDLPGGKTPEQILADARSFVAKVHEALPETKIYFLSIRPSIKRANIREQEKRTNALIEAFSKTDKRLGYIDICAVMYDAQGKLRDDVFIKDNLHLNRKGYELFFPLVKKRLTEDLGPSLK